MKAIMNTRRAGEVKQEGEKVHVCSKKEPKVGHLAESRLSRNKKLGNRT